MPLTTRQLSNIGAPLYSPTGVLLTGVSISFTLVDSSGGVTDAFDVITGERILGVVNTVTDINGIFTINLWPNDRGDKVTKYICSIARKDILNFTSQVPSGAGVLSWLNFRTNGVILTPSQVTTLDAHIADSNVHLTPFKLNLWNALNTIKSLFTTTATVARTWTMPDKDGTVAMTSDITGTNSGTNTGDQTNISGNAATVTTNANLTGVVTSVGNATAIADAALSIAKTSGLQVALDAKQGTLTNSAGLAAALADETGFAGGGVAVGSNGPLLKDVAIDDAVNGRITLTNSTTENYILSAITGGGTGKQLAILATILRVVANDFSSEFLRISAGILAVTGAISATTTIKSSGATSGIGYATGAGGAVTQITGRTTGVTLNTVSGAITLVSAAGTATWQSFTVTNSAVEATDVIKVCQKSGTDLNMIHVTAVAAGSFQISFATTGGVTVEQPVFNFAVIKAVAA